MKLKTRTILVIAALTAIALICVKLLIFETTLKYGLILLGAIAVAFLVWKAFIKNSREEIRRLEKREESMNEQLDALNKTISSLNRQLEEKDRSRINVVGLSPILHVAVFNIDSSFVRPYVRERDGLRFEGALRAEICAEYGIKLEEVRFRYDRAEGVLRVKNFNPGLISFSKKQLTWDIAHSSRTVSVLGHELPSFTDSTAEAFTSEMCDELRNELEREIDMRQIAEFDWLSPMLTNQVTDMLRLMLGRPETQIVIADDDSNDDLYLDFNSFASGRTEIPAQAEPADEQLS